MRIVRPLYGKETSAVGILRPEYAVGQAAFYLVAALASFAIRRDDGKVRPTACGGANAAVLARAARPALPFLAVCLYCNADWQSGLTSAYSGARGAQFTCFHQRRSRAR